MGSESFHANNNGTENRVRNSVHRYQGSESAHAVIVMDMCTQFQTREALYTAVTRGAKTVSLHGDTTTLRAALGRSSRACRVTKLCERLSSALAKRQRED